MEYNVNRLLNYCDDETHFTIKVSKSFHMKNTSKFVIANSYFIT